jgi:hypothetical protein
MNHRRVAVRERERENNSSPQQQKSTTLHHRANIRLTTPGMILVIPLRDWSKRGKKLESAFVSASSQGKFLQDQAFINVLWLMYTAGGTRLELHTVACYLAYPDSLIDHAAGE